MGAQGTTTINFGGYPGSTFMSLDISQPSIAASSLAEAWLMPAITGDHSIEEQILNAPRIFAGNVQAGVGFTIYAVADNTYPVPDAIYRYKPSAAVPRDDYQEKGRVTPMPWGQYNVAWCWN